MRIAISSLNKNAEGIEHRVSRIRRINWRLKFEARNPKSETNSNDRNGKLKVV